MAAYESWAGGKVGAGQDATSWSLKPRGGYIPLADIPNAPKGVDMPLAKYQGIPSIRHEYVSTDLDMKSRAADLMQKPLPGSFDEAGDIRTAAAGKGQMAWGKAIEAGGKEVGDAIGTFGHAVARLQGEALRSKDETDLLRHDDLEKLRNLELNNMEKTTPPAEWAAKTDAINDKFMKAAEPLGVTPVTKTRLAARRDALLSTSATNLEIAAATLSLEQDLKFRTDSIKTNRETGAYDDNDDHYRYMENKGYWKPEQVKLEKEKDEQLKSQANFAIAKQNNPRAAMDEAQTVMDGGTSKDFPFLNKNNAAQAFVEARGATNAKEQIAFTEISNQIAAGNLVNEKQIKNEARVRGLGEKDAQQLVDSFTAYRDKAAKDADANMTLDPAALVTAKKLIMDYEEAADAGGTKYRDAVKFINSNLPPAQRGMLLEKLNNKTTEAMDKKAPEAIARERETDNIGKEVKALGEKGLQFEKKEDRVAFQNAAKDLKDGKALTPEQLDVWRRGNQWVEDKLNEIDAEVVKEPDFAPGELRTKIRERMAPDIQKNIGSGPDPSPAPRRSPVTSVTVPTREQLSTAPAVVPSQWVATSPRNVNSESAQFQQAMVSGGERYSNVRFTAYTPGKGNIEMEGPNKVSARGGPAFTFEGYQRGTFPYVSAAVDPKSGLAGKYFISPAHPNVVLKGEDTGSAFVGAGESHIDIAFEDPQKAGNYEITGDVKVIGEAEALRVSGATRRGGAGGSYSSTQSGAMPALLSKVDTLRQHFPELGKITSGVRSEAGNLKAGGASDSEHTHGNAVDISVAGMPVARQRELIRAASLLGVKGIGVYGTKLHFDLGLTHGPRAWGPSYRRGSVPSWAESEIQEHERRYGVG